MIGSTGLPKKDKRPGVDIYKWLQSFRDSKYLVQFNPKGLNHKHQHKTTPCFIVYACLANNFQDSEMNRPIVSTKLIIRLVENLLPLVDALPT